MSDESDNKNIYKALFEKTQKKLAEVESIAKIGTWEYLISSREVFWSEQMYQIFDRSSDKGNPSMAEVHESIHHADRFQWELLINKVTIDGGPIDIVIRVLDSNDDIKWIRKTARGVFEDKHLISIRGFCQDITEMKRLETHFALTKNLIED